ncbi:tyrosine-protein phosphatase [Streptomyces sp. NPDC001941]|uniref:tyrosine-protein phosphatase n=1 Tax=Streptomyces sp. NPDC001941 TaxID=3154659 RepID=UPI00331738B3
MARRALTRRALLGTACATAAAVATTGFVRPARAAGRPLALQGAVNARDLGGHRTYDGKAVRTGLLYRADALNKLTDADLGVLGALGLRRVVDFRIAAEVGYDGPDRLPPGLAPTARPVTDNGLFSTLLTTIGSRDPVLQERVFGGGRAAAFMRETYRSFVTSAANRAAFGATLRDAAGGPLPLLYHCTAGKDRTGWTSYLVLTLVGVPERTATDDFLASNAYRAAYDAQVRAGLKQQGLMQDPDLLVPLQEVRTEYLRTALDQAEADYGSLYRYVTSGLGVDLRTLVALRERLVG